MQSVSCILCIPLQIMTLMTFDPITGELVDHATVPVSPTSEYAQAFKDELAWTPLPERDTKAERFMLSVWHLLHKKGYC